MSMQYSRSRAPNEPPETWMMQILSGFMATQYVHVAAKLGLADRLMQGPRTAEELAEGCGADANALFRLLRALASMGVFTQIDGGRFELTALGKTLAKDAPSSLHAIACMYGEDWFWRPYGALHHGVTTGRPAFEHVFGEGFYDHFAHRPEAARIFDAAMDSFAAVQARRIVTEYDFGRFGRVMDVGGNRGALLLEVLRAHPKVRGVLFDRSHVVEAMAGRLGQIEADIRDRVELVGGDFMQEIPPGCDAYVLRNVLQDWGDEEARTLLARCRNAMSAEGTLLVIGRLVEPGNDPYPGKFTDLTMMVLTGGRERTAEEMHALLSQAGFSLGSITRTSAMVAVIEAKPH